MNNLKFFESLQLAKEAIFIGLLNTIGASFCSIIIGTILGVLFGFVLTYGNKVMKIPFRIYIDIVRGIPSLVIIFSVYYFIDFFIRLPLFFIGVLALSMNCTAHIAELTRGALQSIPKGQIEAGKAIGLRFSQIVLFILLPQALTRMLPPWVNTATETVKGSTLLALIGISELLLVTQQLIATNNKALKYYIFVGVLFFMLNVAIESTGKYLEKKLHY